MSEPRPIAEGLFTLDGEARLRGATCRACTKSHFPGTALCPYCGEEACTDTLLGPLGRLSLYTVVTSRPPGYRGPTPYGFGVVELDGGLLVISRLTEHRMDQLRPGLPMRLVIEELFTDDDQRPVLSYAFTPETR